MSREEQIIEASRNTIFETGLIRLDDISFIAGAKWADEHPRKRYRNETNNSLKI